LQSSDGAVHRRIAGRIRQLAQERGLPLSHLPDRAGVTRSHFYEVLGARKSPTVTWLAKVARALDVDVADLVVRPAQRGDRVGGPARR
jgi:transcriptional regulator with XRE-family HTH domain